jgi:hypothetical protein
MVDSHGSRACGVNRLGRARVGSIGSAASEINRLGQECLSLIKITRGLGPAREHAWVSWHACLGGWLVYVID